MPLVPSSFYNNLAFFTVPISGFRMLMFQLVLMRRHHNNRPSNKILLLLVVVRSLVYSVIYTNLFSKYFFVCVTDKRWRRRLARQRNSRTTCRRRRKSRSCSRTCASRRNSGKYASTVYGQSFLTRSGIWKAPCL